MKNPVSPSTTGVRPRMTKLYDGRNVATRPIPIVVEVSDMRAIAAAAADQAPKAVNVNMPSGPRPKMDATAVFGQKIPSPGDNGGSTGAVFNPSSGLDHFAG